MKPDTLLMLSGGLDSVGLFWQLMQGQKRLHVHHMNLKNVENRADAEAIAVSRIVEYMRKVGDFDFTESTHQYPSHRNSFIWDSDLVSFMAGTICMFNRTIKEVAIGMTASDTIGTRIKRSDLIFNAFNTKAVKTYPLTTMTKEQVYDMTPSDLRDLCWSCRTPQYVEGVPVACRRCITCKAMKKIHDRPN